MSLYLKVHHVCNILTAFYVTGTTIAILLGLGLSCSKI